VKSLFRLIVAILLVASVAFSARAAFTSLYAFGDGICTTTNGPGGGGFYGHRNCNGRVWLEVLAQWQGITYESNKNWSYYGHYSKELVTNLNNFPAPTDASNALFVIWVADADFVYGAPSGAGNFGTNLTQWTTNINQFLTNHFVAITNLYGKGARTLVMPNAVDLMKVPRYLGYAAANRAFIRQRVIDFNVGFTNLLSNTAASLPGLKIYVPDCFTLLDSVVANSTNFGLIKPATFVIEDLPSSQWTTNPPAVNYVFWDDLNPTAKFQMYISDLAQQLLSPAAIGGITASAGSNRLDLVNVPIGRNGLVESSTSFVSWTTNNGALITSTNTAQSVFVPVSDAIQFYRLRFPFVWTWP
jgi:hypothetical protein